MQDALQLKRENLRHDTDKGIYRIVTNRMQDRDRTCLCRFRPTWLKSC